MKPRRHKVAKTDAKKEGFFDSSRPSSRHRVFAVRSLLARINDDRGAVAVSFILTFPIFLIIIAVVVQYALLLNAKVMVDQAAYAAARAAVTSLPDQRPDNIDRAARMVLAPLSPQAGGSIAGEASAVTDALVRNGIDPGGTFASRYTYAMVATHVSYPGGDYSRRSSQEVEVTVRYRFYLTVPGARNVIAPRVETIAGVEGRFFEIVSTARAQTADGRRTRAHGDGWPQ